ncbi:hypothetical protein [Burkholderia vietnamiensis]|uniref:hypothetical protein n=1 Tax=Burkholderia vietnamiensis TaxID=60552 RepID=UPI001129F8E3|nr:hypothetical protein [Burkholderia vietnamiensis]HDR8964626.1 hypothetical protein [Burkholderia vietnamiensis]HDR9128872.1 hypothetical protein [Burkholderia vietnamiensis]
MLTTKENGPGPKEEKTVLNYEDLSDAQLDQLQAANLRYHGFLAHRGELDAQARSDRAAYPHLLTRSQSGEGCVSDEKAVEFLMEVTGLPHEVCVAYQNA